MVEVVIAASPAGFAVSCHESTEAIPSAFEASGIQGIGRRMRCENFYHRYCHCLSLIGRRTFGLSRATNQSNSSRVAVNQRHCPREKVS